MAVSSATSTIIPAMAAATVELWSAGGQTMEKVRDSLAHTVERVGEMVSEAQERLVREERVRCAFKPSFLRDDVEEVALQGRGRDMRQTG